MCVYALKRENIVSVKASFYLFMFFFPGPARFSFLEYHSLVSVSFTSILHVPTLTCPEVLFSFQGKSGFLLWAELNIDNFGWFQKFSII